MGDAANIASRLEELSERGQILVGPDTYRLTNSIFEYQEFRQIRVRGRSEQITVYRALGLSPRPGPTRGLRGISSPMVGRDAELATLISCIESLLGGSGGIVSVIGEAGLGKSRLMAEVKRTMADKSLLWLEGRTLSYSQNIGYWPFLEIIRSYSGIIETDNEAEAWAKLSSRIENLFPDHVAEILPYLASLLSIEVKGDLAERVKYLSGEDIRSQTFRASYRFFERLAQDRPLILVFEDLHWADQSSLELLKHILPLMQRVPLLFVGISRLEDQSPASRLMDTAVHDYSDYYTQIILSPLSPANSAQLVQNLLKIDNLSSRLSDLIQQKAEGNPFFVEEVIRSLIDMGGIVQDEATGRWRATAQIEEIAIPDTIQGVIMARVDRLSSEVRQVLKTAAVIGRSFFYRILRTIADAERELDRHITELQNVELIRERSRIPELEYIFKHALAHEAVYKSTLLQQRRELHHQVGKCIEALFADRLEEFYGLLAYHYAQAEEWEKAQEYLFKASDQAGKVAADAEALAHYQQAMTAYSRVFGEKWDPLQRAILERKMGEALFRRGEHQEAMEYLQRALLYLGRRFPASRWKVRTAIITQLIIQLIYRLLPFIHRTVNPAAEELVRIYEVKGWIDYFMDQERLLLDALMLLNIAEQNKFFLGAVRGYMGVGIACDLIPVFWLGGQYHRRAIALAEQLSHPVATGHAYFGMAIHETYQGNWETAMKLHQQALEAYWAAGNMRGWGAAKSLLARLFYFRGDFTRSMDLYNEPAQAGQEGADYQVWGWGTYGQGTNLLATGALDEAEIHLKQAIELLKSVPDYQLVACANGDLGECYLRQGKLTSAIEVLEESNKLIKERKLRGHFVTTPRNGLTEAYLIAAEQAEGAERSDLLKKARRTCKLALRQGKAVREGLPCASRLRGTYEWLRGRSSARKWWEKSLSAADKLEARYDAGLTYLEMGRRMKDQALIKKAEAILTEIGAELDSNQARKLLE